MRHSAVCALQMRSCILSLKKTRLHQSSGTAAYWPNLNAYVRKREPLSPQRIIPARFVASMQRSARRWRCAHSGSVRYARTLSIRKTRVKGGAKSHRPSKYIRSTTVILWCRNYAASTNIFLQAKENQAKANLTCPSTIRNKDRTCAT